MRKMILSLFLLLVCLHNSKAQQRDMVYYLEQAKKNSPLIDQAKNDNKIVSLDLQQMNKVLFKPEISVVSGFMLSPIISKDNNKTSFQLVSEGASDYIGHDLAITDGGQYQAMVSIRQPVLSRTKYKAYVNKAEISGKINENKISLTVHELDQIVGYQYLLCIKSFKESKNALSLYLKTQEQYGLLKKLVENAVYKQTDLMLMQIELENCHLAYETNRAAYHSSLYDLNLLCGITDTSDVELMETDLKMNPAIRNRSAFLTGYSLDSLNILSDQAVNELKYKPQLDIIADGGLNAAYLPYPRRLGLSAGISLTWNIYDGHQRDILREKSVVSLQTIEFAKNNFMTQNEINKNKVLYQINSLIERISLNEQQTEKYKLLYDAYLKELSIGEASIMDLKNLIRDNAALDQELLQLKMEQQFLINSYNYLNY